MRLTIPTLLFGLTTLASLPAQPSREDLPKIPEDIAPTTTASGLKYSVLTEGHGGRSPNIGDQVRVHYTGWLTNGTVFDSSRMKKIPADFIVGQVIDGWNEGLQLMTVGARYKLSIPYDLAYGEAGHPPIIPPKSDLIFDVELLAITPGPDFVKPSADAQTTTDSGLKYQVLGAGNGTVPAAGTPLEMEFAFWNTSGQLLQCSRHNGPLYGGAGAFQLPVLSEASLLMKPGAHLLLEVPPSLAFADRDNGPLLPGGSTTIWQLRLTRAIQPPVFTATAEEDLKQTDSGLKYEIIEAGEGESPRMGQAVTVHYTGWLTDGTEFDSSYGNGAPATFQLGRVIAGWNEGLQLMKPGAVYRFVIPGDLAYGERGSPPKIGPDATLIIHVTRLSVR